MRERIRILTERIDALLAEANQMNVGVEELLDLFRVRELEIVKNKELDT